MALTDFYPGTTKKFSVKITLNGTTPNISGDTVTFYMKRSPNDVDGDAAIMEMADVLTSGATGTALFTLTPAETAVAVRGYHYDIVWTQATGEEYVLTRGTVKVIDRVSDVS